MPSLCRIYRPPRIFFVRVELLSLAIDEQHLGALHGIALAKLNSKPD
jgi:hypothetical protein